ncbi:MAG: ACP S-malonyltransferase, partial [Bacteroidales bacterium]|nr:ACP S-malonyltransferase [Bacteroidales bacterium]
GMGKDLYDQYPQAKAMFEEANDILGFRITDLMFSGTDEDLKQTRVTQPAVFIHSVVDAFCRNLANGERQMANGEIPCANNDFVVVPDMVAGHSLGEFSALVVAKSLSFADGLRLVYARAMAMQKACELQPSTMAAILGLPDETVEKICSQIASAKGEGQTANGEAPCAVHRVPCTEIVVPANYNSPGQLVISGTIKGVELACEKLKEAGAKRALPLKVGGAFHSPLMQPAAEELKKAIEQTEFKTPICPIYQNVDAKPHTNPDDIKANLILQLTAPVRWTQIVQNMLADGATDFTEFGPGNVLTGLVAKIKGH